MKASVGSQPATSVENLVCGDKPQWRAFFRLEGVIELLAKLIFLGLSSTFALKICNGSVKRPRRE